MTDEIAELCVALGLVATPEQVAALSRYAELLQRWNATYNLTAVRAPADILSHHLADCLAIIPPMRRQPGTRVLDVGSGGGLPGVIVAIMRPECQVICVDTVGKKAAFVRQVAGALGLRNLQARHQRVEDLREAPFDIVTARAFASLPDLVKGTRALLAPGGVWMAMKGKVPHDEMAALPPETEVFHVEQIRVPHLDAERCLVWIRTRQRPAA